MQFSVHTKQYYLNSVAVSSARRTPKKKYERVNIIFFKKKTLRFIGDSIYVHARPARR
jgi:hypothetical protein